MSAEGCSGAIRVAIAGLDHWYTGLAAADAAATIPDVELIIGHRDTAHAEETAARFGAVEVTTDFTSLARRDDIDILITACRSSDNPDVCIEAAQHGMNIISVKPFATNRGDAERVRDAVQRAGVLFFPWESAQRLGDRYRAIEGWIDEGRIGRPVSAAYVMRAHVPRIPWPGESGDTWWLDPAHVPGGGWIDHAIYAVDSMRGLFGAEVGAIGGIVARLVDPSLAPALEDYGVATLTMTSGAGASIEVTWTAAHGAFFETMQIVGTEGSIVAGTDNPGRATLIGNVAPFEGRVETAFPRRDDNAVAAMIRAMRGEASLPAGIDDAVRNLDACLTFYEAASAGRTLPVGQEVPS
jgi:predicted dehydrogenase